MSPLMSWLGFYFSTDMLLIHTNANMDFSTLAYTALTLMEPTAYNLLKNMQINKILILKTMFLFALRALLKRRVAVLGTHLK